MEYRDFIKDINEENIERVYLLYGSEKYLVKKSIEALKNRYINDANNENFNFSFFDGLKDDIDVIINSCDTLPFMGEKRIVIVKARDAFSGSKGSLNKDNEEKLMQYLSKIPETTCLVFEAEEKIDKRKKIVKEINKNGKVFEFKKLDKSTLSKWVQKILSSNNKKITSNSLESLIDSLGYLDKDSSQTLYDVENEVLKLCNFTADKKTIEIADVEKIMSKPLENNIFLLVDAVANKDGNLALSVFNQMLIGGEPEARILYMIIRQFKLLYKVRIMVDRGYTATAIAPKISLTQYIAKKYVKQANAFTDKELLNILNTSLEADIRIKTGKMLPKLAIEMLITQCCK